VVVLFALDLGLSARRRLPRGRLLVAVLLTVALLFGVALGWPRERRCAVARSHHEPVGDPTRHDTAEADRPDVALRARLDMAR
jgi:hypothetical protein